MTKADNKIAYLTSQGVSVVHILCPCAVCVVRVLCALSVYCPPQRLIPPLTPPHIPLPASPLTPPLGPPLIPPLTPPPTPPHIPPLIPLLSSLFLSPVRHIGEQRARFHGMRRAEGSRDHIGIPPHHTF